MQHPTVRVGFILPELGDGWLGGLNYYSALISAILELRSRVIEPVVFVNDEATSDYLKLFAGAPVVRTKLLQTRTLANTLWKLSGRTPGGWHPLLEGLLRAHHVSVISHFRPVRLFGAASITWIPDFQDLHLPENFSPLELALRQRVYANAQARSDAIVVSSFDAATDLRRFFPDMPEARVLRFVPRVDVGGAHRHPVSGAAPIPPYFFLPAQFWRHKNHAIVLDALEKLRDQGVAALVVATGKEFDHRHPDHAANLLRAVVDRNLTQHFVSRGAIAYAEVQALMRGALAVINPSRFEGWSTTVEEAALLGKRVLLSDIPVHLEQAPPMAMYFPPDDADELARLMKTVLERPVEPADVETLSRRYRAKRLKFARRFQSIVLEVWRRRRGTSQVRAVASLGKQGCARPS